MIIFNLHEYNNYILQCTKLVYKNISLQKKAFNKFSLFHLASEVLVLDLEPNTFH